MLETRALLSAVTLAGDVSDVGPINESAVDEAASGDDITVNAGVTIESTGSDITYLAGDDINLQVGSVTRAEGSITLSVDFADADSGQGGVLNLADSAVLESSVETSIFGGPDSDTFNIIPQLGSSLLIVGDGGDNVLNLDLTGTTGASLQSTPTGTTISFTSDHQPIQLNDVTEINVSNGTLAVNLSDAAGQTDVAFDGGDVVVSIAGQEVLRTDALGVSGPLTVNGTDASDDTLMIDFSNGNPIPNGINFSGGIGGNDTVEINGGSFANVGYTFTNENDGDVNWDGTTLIYTGLEPIIDNSNAVDRVFTFTGGAETITLSDDGTASDGFSLIDSTLGESVVFQNPTGALTVNAGSGVDVIDLLAIDDATTIPALTINGGNEADTINGGAIAAGTFTTVILNGNVGNDIITGTDGIDTINGGADNDTIVGGLGADLQFGNAGNDLFIWNNGDGPDDNTGGADVDTFTFNGADGADDVLNLFAGPGDGSLVGAAFTLERTAPSAFTIEGVEIENINVNGLAGNDTVDGSALPAGIFTNVTINGGDGNDNLTGTDGVDTINGGADNDTITGGLGADLQFGNAGNDLFIWNNGDGPDDNTGGADVDTFTFNGADGADDVLNLFAGPGDGSLVGAAFTLERTAPSAFTIEGVEIENINVNGLAGNDTVDGSALPAGIFTNVTINGGDGNDNLTGTDGVDTINGGSDNDTITGGLGADLQFGNAGDDLFIWNNGDGPDDNTGGADVDTFTFNGADGADDVLNLFAGPGDGSLVGAAFTLERTAPSAFTIEGGEIENINVNGLAGNDTVDGSSLPAGIFTNVTINGGAGDDVLTGTQGVDIIDGGAGNDTNSFQGIQLGVTATINADGTGTAAYGNVNETFTGIENLIGSNNDDILTAIGEVNGILNGAGGNDVLNGGTGTTLIGGDGIDGTSIEFGDAAVSLDLSNSTNGLQILERFSGESRTVDGFESIELLTGDFRNIFRVFARATPSLQQISIIAGNGDNFINAWRTDLTINVTAGNGNDVIWTGLANDTVSSGDGRDIIWTNSGDDTVDAGNGDNHVFAGLGNDVVTAGSGRDILRGGVGNDNLNSGDGNDRIFGGIGDDTLIAGAGNDVLFGGWGDDTLDAGDGNDVAYGHLGNDIINGGGENDRLFGGLGDDTLDGGEGNDWVIGNGGDDILIGGSGHDRIWGGTGDDTLIAGAGNDVLFGGWGDDTLDAGDGNDVVYGHHGNDIINGGGGNDRLFGGLGDDTLDGSEGNDWVIGNGGDDILFGGSGHDRIWGGTGRDLLFGGPGRDSLFGGLNDDLLISGSTTLNTNQIQSVRSEWASNRSIEIRLANITDGTGSTDRLNGGALLNTLTLEADQERDRLFGQSGIDAFFASATDRTVRNHFESLLDL